MEKKKIEKFLHIFPIYEGISADLLFWRVIDTLFLTLVRHLSLAQITSLTAISTMACIILQIPILKAIEKIGNTKSVRLGSLLVLISSILLTMGNNYILIALGCIIAEIAFTMKNMSSVILKNNLEMQGNGEKYVKIKAKSNIIYSIITMIISFIASYMFNINNYLPMVFCILFCLISYILSYYIIDFSKYDKIENIKYKKTKNKNYIKKYTKILIIIIISYGIFYPAVNVGQSNGKLFIQQELLEVFNKEKTALIIGIILCMSRIVRLVSNLLFDKAYTKYKEKMSIILSSLLTIAIGLLIVGSFINNVVLIKFLVMSLGYIIILFIRDPFKIYMQNLALDNSKKSEQQVLLTTLSFVRKVGKAILSLCFTFILINNQMVNVMIILLILSIIEIFVSKKLYKLNNT